MSENTAFSPASLSFIFKVCPDPNLLRYGSVGCGCTLDCGVTAIVEQSSFTELIFNGKKTKIPTVSWALEKIYDKPLKIILKSDLPLGYGFGLSAATTISALSIVNKLFKLGKKKDEIIKLAHISEIVNKTGLGSVTTQTTGGFLIKESPGIPFRYRKIFLDKLTFYATIFGSLDTSSVLTKPKFIEKINREADKSLAKLKWLKDIHLSNILDISLEFAKNSGLLKDEKLLSFIEEIKKQGGHATMAMLGKVVISDLKPRNTRFLVKKLTIVDNQI